MILPKAQAQILRDILICQDNEALESLLQNRTHNLLVTPFCIIEDGFCSMEAPENIQGLVENFTTHLDAYKSVSYNETQLRVVYVNPLFEALGWDINNKKGSPPGYQDVLHEYSLKTAEGTKAPDYCFCPGGLRKFFLETKKPAVDIKDDRGSAFQVRRYGWTGKLALSILTNFKEFAVYDCRIKPNPKDRASVARIECLNYTEYIDKWDYLQSTFSKDAVKKWQLGCLYRLGQKEEGHNNGRPVLFGGYGGLARYAGA